MLLTALRLREEIVRLDVDARVARLFVSKQSRSFRSKLAVRSMLMEFSSIYLRSESMQALLSSVTLSSRTGNVFPKLPAIGRVAFESRVA